MLSKSLELLDGEFRDLFVILPSISDSYRDDDLSGLVVVFVDEVTYSARPLIRRKRGLS